MVLSDIDNQQVETDTEQLEVIRIKEKAYFLRVAYYFTLVDLCAKPYMAVSARTDLVVPIKASEFVEDKVYSRNTVGEVYGQV